MLKKVISLLVIGVMAVSTSLVSFADDATNESDVEVAKTMEELIQEDIDEFKATHPENDKDNLDNFKNEKEYIDGQFTDIPANAWYLNGVKKAFETSLMNGTRADHFNPNGNVSIAEAITLAARLHSIYYADGNEFTKKDGEEWYQPYVDYAIENYIVLGYAYNNYTQPATRLQFADILVKALPPEALKNINSISEAGLPDLSFDYDGAYGNSKYRYSVYKLYAAGILTGNDKYGTFTPNSNIKRSEVATIACRMIDKRERKQFKLKRKMLLESSSNGVIRDKYDPNTNSRTFIENNDTKRIFYYDTNGSRIKNYIYDENGNLKEWIEYDINAYGHMDSHRTYDANGKMIEAWYNFYDDEFKLIKNVWYDLKGKEKTPFRRSTAVYVYRPDGQMSECLEASGYSDKGFETSSTSEYDALGRIICSKGYNSVTKFEYIGNVVKIGNFYGNGEKMSDPDVYYFDDSGRLIKKEDYSAYGLHKVTEYTYYSDGTLKLELGTDAYGKVTDRIEYNSAGKEISQLVSYAASGSLSAVEKLYKCTYNSDGTLKHQDIYDHGKLKVSANYKYIEL